jgi:hypothetical protein
MNNSSTLQRVPISRLVGGCFICLSSVSWLAQGDFIGGPFFTTIPQKPASPGRAQMGLIEAQIACARPRPVCAIYSPPQICASMFWIFLQVHQPDAAPGFRLLVCWIRISTCMIFTWSYTASKLLVITTRRPKRCL